ncbi:uncharacterized protein LOC142592583 isoform X2 [Dermacentor variabilis]|uniref:uncharacterized protein LOC142592583 isoform X2 n=1 Tax=Dermacentor variabilis TaxID=34621 RepID=UPI003F5C358D
MILQRPQQKNSVMPSISVPRSNQEASAQCERNRVHRDLERQKAQLLDMQWQALPCVPKTMPTPSHSSSLIQTPQAKRPWRQMQAASTPRTATLTAGVSP